MDTHRHHAKETQRQAEVITHLDSNANLVIMHLGLFYPADSVRASSNRADRETAARITEEIGNLMKEIETLVEEKSKESSDLTQLINDDSGVPVAPRAADESVLDDITVSMTSNALNGSERVVLDGVVTDDECRELHRLSNASVQASDITKSYLIIFVLL